MRNQGLFRRRNAKVVGWGRNPGGCPQAGTGSRRRLAGRPMADRNGGNGGGIGTIRVVPAGDRWTGWRVQQEVVDPGPQCGSWRTEKRWDRDRRRDRTVRGDTVLRRYWPCGTRKVVDSGRCWLVPDGESGGIGLEIGARRGCRWWDGDARRGRIGKRWWGRAPLRRSCSGGAKAGSRVKTIER